MYTHMHMTHTYLHTQYTYTHTHKHMHMYKCTHSVGSTTHLSVPYLREGRGLVMEQGPSMREEYR